MSPPASTAALSVYTDGNPVFNAKPTLRLWLAFGIGPPMAHIRIADFEIAECGFKLDFEGVDQTSIHCCSPQSEIRNSQSELSNNFIRSHQHIRWNREADLLRCFQ